MKLSFSVLEEVRRDPAAYKQKLQAPPGFFPKSGYHRILECVLLRYHKYGLGVPAARQQLTEWCQKRFPSNSGLKKTLQKFDQYINSFTALGNDTVITRQRLSLGLPDDIAKTFAITGQVPRIDITGEGDVAVWMFSKTKQEWSSELRFPLMQAATANALGRDLEEVSIGVYCFEDGQHYSFSFTEEQVQTAMNELLSLLLQLG